MKTSLAGPNAMSRIRVFLIATCIIAVTPRLSADIILLSRLSDASAGVYGYPDPNLPPPQSQTGFLPANLRNSAFACCIGIGGGCNGASSTSNSSILINNPMEGLRVVGDGTASVGGTALECGAFASAKLIVLSFTLTEVPYPYSISGQLNGAHARAKLTGETGTIFEMIGTTTLSESGILPPGNYTLSVNLEVAPSSASFTFALDGPVSTPRATNLSTRLLVGTGNDVGIGGFIVTGSGPRHLLLRGIGPLLSQFGILNFLPDPVLELHGPSGFTTVSNDNWRDTQEAEIIATGRAPSNDHESAIVADLAPGTYTAILAGSAGTTGVGLVEIYDLSPNQDSGLANISTRGNVGTGDDIMIGGFILDGGGGADAIIVRGLGPSLAAFGIPNVLANPQLELRNSNGVLLRSNNNWMDDPAQAGLISAAGLAPGNTLEAALVESLSPGTYTALLSGTANGAGIGLVEVYDHVTVATPTPGPTPTPTPTASPTPGGRTCTENFDGVTAPALPAGWVASNPDPGNGMMWATSTSASDTPPNAAFIFDQDGISDKVLDRLNVSIIRSAVMTFRNNFDTEFSDGTYWDGYVLEVSAPNISGGAFLDITDSQVGGSFVSGGYTGTISTKASNPLSGRMAWSGSSSGYIDTVINLGPNLVGQTVTFRFRMGSDEAVAAPGVHIDGLHIDGASCQ
jgi:hypothetical protein